MALCRRNNRANGATTQIFATFAPCMKSLFRRLLPQYVATLRLAAPVALSQLGFVVVQFADNAMVGAYGGDDTLPLAAVSFGVMMSFVLFSLALGVTLGLTPLVGEHFARGEYRATAHYLQVSLVMNSVLGLIFMGVQIASEPLLYMLSQPVEVVDMALPYYRLMAYSIPAVMIYGCFKQFLEGVGNTIAPMFIALASNLVNIFLNWLFIFGHWGFEPMGVYGAGLATLISRVSMPFVALAFFAIRSQYRDYLALFSRGVRYLSNIANLLRVGVPIAGQMFLEGIAFIVTSIMMGWLGAEAIAANQIGGVYGNAAFMMTVAIGSAATIRTSHAFGRGDRVALRDATLASLHVGVVWGVLVFVSFMALNSLMPRLFTTNESVIVLASTMIIYIAVYQVSDALQGTLVGILRGVQDVRIIAILSFVAYVLLNIPVGYLCAFVFGMGAEGLMVGYIVGLSVAAVGYFVRVRRRIR